MVRTLHRDRAGNRIVKENDGRFGVVNKNGSYVNKADAAKMLRQHGYGTKKIGKKLYATKQKIF